MACEIFLVPLEGVAIAADRVRSVALANVPRDERWHVGEIEEGWFVIEMPLGLVDVSDSHVTVRLDGVSPEVFRLIHSIAKRAELAIVNEVGGPHVLLADPGHLERLPPELRREEPTVCAVASELAKAIGPAFDSQVDEKHEAIRRRNEEYRQWTRDHRVRAIGSGDPYPNVPGLAPTPESRPVYVGMKAREGPSLLFRRFTRFVRARRRDGGAMPYGGGVGGSGWQIRLPTGEVFSCLILSGYHWGRDDHEGNWCRRIDDWTRIVQEFADGTGRRTARIDDGASVVLSDGSTLALAACESRRATDEDG